MADTSKLRHQSQRGEHAKRILEDPLVVEAFEAVQSEIIRLWRSTEGHEAQDREKAYLMDRLLRNLRSQFEAHVRTGQMAQKELWAIEKREGLRKRMGRKIRRGQ